MNVYLIQTGETTWDADERVESPNGAPLTDSGAQTATLTACELSAEDVQAVYAGDAEAEEQTARLIAEQLKVKLFLRPELRDMNFGLWQGLTHDEIKRRRPKLYKQWLESPAGACPPGGETVAEATERLKHALQAIEKKHKGAPVAIVARPMIIGVLRCLLTHERLDELSANIERTFTWRRFEVEDLSFA